VCCGVLQCVAMCCSVLQCAVVCCSTLHVSHVFLSREYVAHGNASCYCAWHDSLQYAALCHDSWLTCECTISKSGWYVVGHMRVVGNVVCWILQGIAVCCRVLRRVAACHTCFWVENTSCHILEWVISFIGTNHVWHGMRMSPVTHQNESCHTWFQVENTFCQI
jgi:hypothetical protein